MYHVVTRISTNCSIDVIMSY